MKKVFYLLLLLVVASCSTKQERTEKSDVVADSYYIRELAADNYFYNFYCDIFKAWPKDTCHYFSENMRAADSLTLHRLAVLFNAKGYPIFISQAQSRDQAAVLIALNPKGDVVRGYAGSANVYESCQATIGIDSFRIVLQNPYDPATPFRINCPQATTYRPRFQLRNSDTLR